ncbi:hypothetical protein K505DRAFT_291764 [Melanomma pulvis-pyrius CBS 109.77]|uniref:DNA-directed DNA polymerase n=1 Tax=Melanomma pulvis-pyrius CBS 109.77 TaxID=1314802 RepID=A0A6A6XYM7_9PLEO|nr:hypothetical protein K505DRAFT_291764 [Melanomma pulvis-pyrius CBS 109.77]
MANQDALALDKEAYFKQQELLDLSDDEPGFSAGCLIVERAIADSRAMAPPPSLVRQRSSFLGPTPRERQAELQARNLKKRSIARPDQDMARSTTKPDMDVSSSFPSVKPKQKRSPSPKQAGLRKRLKHTISLPDPISADGNQDQTPFYKQIGVIPRELRNGKSIKLANHIQLYTEPRQLLKGKIIYFYPNDDVSMARRQRIHKVIQLGAAWVVNWRDDITHIMMDEDIYTYSLLLRHLKKTELPRTVVLVKFDPYIPQCIQFGKLLDPIAGRFLVKGAPRPSRSPGTTAGPSLPPSQSSLQVKTSRRQLAAQNTPTTESISVKDSFPPPILSSLPKNLLSHSHPIEESTEPTDLYNDELSEAIKQTKAISHLPLDEEDEDSLPQLSGDRDEDSGTDVESPKPTPKRSTMFKSNSAAQKGASSKGGFNQAAFQCMHPNSTNSSQNPNARTIEVLDQMCKYYDQMQDQWRTLAYRKGIATLRKQTTKITTAQEAAALPFIGKRLAEKIEEIVLTNRLRRLDNTRDDPTDQTLRLFLGVYGAGLSQANKWIQQGYTTLEDLVDRARLTDSQKVGVQHYEDFATRIPRAEVAAHGAFVRTALQKIDPGFEAQVMGSYRRGAKDSGDIDVMITRPGASIGTLRNVVFEQVVPQLFAADFLKVKLATSSRTSDGTKWHGASCLPTSNVWRRLDLLIVPEEELGAALIYFTGNDIFNRSLRLLASKKGMRLNQRGLYKDVIRGKAREKITDGTLLEGRDEKKIFEELGVPWREPTERIC